MCRWGWAEVDRLLFRDRHRPYRDGCHRSLGGSLIIEDTLDGAHFATLNHLNHGCRHCSVMMSVESAHVETVAQLTLCAGAWWSQLLMDAPASVYKMHQDRQEDQEGNSGQLKNIHILSPRLWLVGEGGRDQKSGVGSTMNKGGILRNSFRAGKQKVKYHQRHIELGRDDGSGVRLSAEEEWRARREAGERWAPRRTYRLTWPKAGLCRLDSASP